MLADLSSPDLRISPPPSLALWLRQHSPQQRQQFFDPMGPNVSLDNPPIPSFPQPVSVREVLDQPPKPQETQHLGHLRFSCEIVTESDVPSRDVSKPTTTLNLGHKFERLQELTTGALPLAPRSYRELAEFMEAAQGNIAMIRDICMLVERQRSYATTSFWISAVMQFLKNNNKHAAVVCVFSKYFHVSVLPSQVQLVVDSYSNLMASSPWSEPSAQTIKPYHRTFPNVVQRRILVECLTALFPIPTALVELYDKFRDAPRARTDDMAVFLEAFIKAGVTERFDDLLFMLSQRLYNHPHLHKNVLLGYATVANVPKVLEGLEDIKKSGEVYMPKAYNAVIAIFQKVDCQAGVEAVKMHLSKSADNSFVPSADCVSAAFVHAGLGNVSSVLEIVDENASRLCQRDLVAILDKFVECGCIEGAQAMEKRLLKVWDFQGESKEWESIAASIRDLWQNDSIRKSRGSPPWTTLKVVHQ
ncbi:hypothetical protein B0H10DRAFT_288128 [Mycena sp. CBHHK59/15]|nr:hypothetical protein B0H10DRAFT_288128 [Mycena sp. CBHHK59/15]